MASNGEVKSIHSSESTKTLLKSEALYEVGTAVLRAQNQHSFLPPESIFSLKRVFFLQYMLKTMVYPRENEFLRELRHITKEHTLYVLPMANSLSSLLP